MCQDMQEICFQNSVALQLKTEFIRLMFLHTGLYRIEFRKQALAYISGSSTAPSTLVSAYSSRSRSTVGL